MFCGCWRTEIFNSGSVIRVIALIPVDSFNCRVVVRFPIFLGRQHRHEQKRVKERYLKPLSGFGYSPPKGTTSSPLMVNSNNKERLQIKEPQQVLLSRINTLIIYYLALLRGSPVPKYYGKKKFPQEDHLHIRVGKYLLFPHSWSFSESEWRSFREEIVDEIT